MPPPTPALAAPADAACLPGRVPDPACPLRTEGTAAAGNAAASGAPELAASAFDWAPRPPGAILDVEEAAGGFMPAAADPAPSRRLLPALLALSGLVVLLRRRPT